MTFDNVGFERLSEVRPKDIIDLMNHPAVRRHLPLARGPFGRPECDRFVAAKERIWEEHGYGPWAFVIDGDLIGWGGLQPEGDDVEIGLVLRPSHWGAGLGLCRRILAHAFRDLRLASVIALLPPSRTRVAAMMRLGFRRDGEMLIENERFYRYRLSARGHLVAAP